MFTGIITGVGRIAVVHALGSSTAHGKRLSITCPPTYLDDVDPGDSIALNGACMTVTTLDTALSQFTVDISAESLDKTAGLAQTGPINLEKALRANDRLGGHLVSGHVDGIGAVTHFAQVGESWELHVLTPKSLAKYLAYKGSITINGGSLTVNHVEDLDAHLHRRRDVAAGALVVRQVGVDDHEGRGVDRRLVEALRVAVGVAPLVAADPDHLD